MRQLESSGDPQSGRARIGRSAFKARVFVAWTHSNQLGYGISATAVSKANGELCYFTYLSKLGKRSAAKLQLLSYIQALYQISEAVKVLPDDLYGDDTIDINMDIYLVDRCDYVRRMLERFKSSNTGPGDKLFRRKYGTSSTYWLKLYKVLAVMESHNVRVHMQAPDLPFDGPYILYLKKFVLKFEKTHFAAPASLPRSIRRYKPEYERN